MAVNFKQTTMKLLTYLKRWHTPLGNTNGAERLEPQGRHSSFLPPFLPSFLFSFLFFSLLFFSFLKQIPLKFDIEIPL